MRIINKIVPGNFNLFCFGDDHEGARARHKKGWDQLIDMINSEYSGVKTNFGIDHGDIVEAVSVDHPHYDGVSTEGNIYHQMQQAKRNRMSIRKKLITILDGNHPMRFWKFFGPNKPALTEVVCNDLGVKFGGLVCVINYLNKDGSRMFSHFLAHKGSGGSMNSVADDPKRRSANIKLSLKRKLKGKVGDCLLMTCGHYHKLIYCEPESELYMTNTGSDLKGKYTGPRKSHGYIHPDYRHYLCCGSFHRTYGIDYDTYAEAAGYDPVELGFFVVRIRDRQIAGIDKILI